MFNEMLAESVAGAVFWLLIIFGSGLTLRFLIRDIIDFMLEDSKKKSPEEED